MSSDLKVNESTGRRKASISVWVTLGIVLTLIFGLFWYAYQMSIPHIRRVSKTELEALVPPELRIVPPQSPNPAAVKLWSDALKLYRPSKQASLMYDRSHVPAQKRALLDQAVALNAPAFAKLAEAVRAGSLGSFPASETGRWWELFSQLMWRCQQAAMDGRSASALADCRLMLRASEETADAQSQGLSFMGDAISERGISRILRTGKMNGGDLRTLAIEMPAAPANDERFRNVIRGYLAAQLSGVAELVTSKDALDQTFHRDSGNPETAPVGQLDPVETTQLAIKIIKDQLANLDRKWTSHDVQEQRDIVSIIVRLVKPPIYSGSEGTLEKMWKQAQYRIAM